MKVSNHFYTQRLIFHAVLPTGAVMERFVYAFLATGKKTILIDSGVKGSLENLVSLVEESGNTSKDVTEIIISHAHPDHIGGLTSAVQTFQCPVYAGTDSIPWIEDIDLQFEQRPAPGFYSIVEGSVKIDQELKGGMTIALDDETELQILDIPGHASGQIGLYCPQDGVLIAADSVPLAGQLPIYDDVLVSLQTLEQLKALPNLKVLLSSWDEPRYDEEIVKVIDDGIGYIHQIHKEVKQAYAEDKELETIAKEVHKALGLKPTDYNPLYVRTIAAHINVLNQL